MTASPVKFARGTKLLIKVGNAASPEAFSVYCTVNAQRGIQFTAAMQEDAIPDCTDPDLPAWLTRDKVSMGATVTGGGILNTTDLSAFFTWFTSKSTKNVQIWVDVSNANGGGYWSGAFHLTEFNPTGEPRATIQCTLTLVSDGVITWTAAT